MQATIEIGKDGIERGDALYRGKNLSYLAYGIRYELKLRNGKKYKINIVKGYKYYLDANSDDSFYDLHKNHNDAYLGPLCAEIIDAIFKTKESKLNIKFNIRVTEVK